MTGLRKRLFLLVLIAVFHYCVVALVSYNNWKSDVGMEVRSEVASLIATSNLFPALGALDPVMHRSRTASGYYLVRDRDGQRVYGNILTVEPFVPEDFERLRNWRVTTEDGPRTVYGRWVRIDNAIDILVARSASRFWSFVLTIAVIFTTVTAGTAMLAWQFAQRQAARDQARLRALSDVFKGFARGERMGHSPVDFSGEALDELTQKLNRSVDRINAYVSVLAFMTRFTSHDVLQSIRRTRDSVLAEETDIDISQLLFRLNGLEAKCSGLVTIAHYETGNEAEFEGVDLASVYKVAAAEYQLEISDRNVILQTDISPVIAPGVKDAITIIIDNILKNAAAYTPDNSTIQVFIGHAPSGRPMVRVRDEGPGIDGFPKGFPFERGPKEAKRGVAGELHDGHGVGLILVYHIARILKIDLHFADRAEKEGLEVTMMFPTLTQFQPHAKEALPV